MSRETISFERACTIARRAAEAPSTMLLKAARSGSFRTALKADGSPQTTADTMSERMIRSVLSEGGYPEDATVLGEEGGEDEGHSAWRWIVDPIDGTTAFTRDIPVYGTLVALQNVESGCVVAGAVRLPGIGETVWAWQGGGAWRDGQRIRVSSTTGLADATIAAGTLFQFRESGVEHLLERLGGAVADMRIFGDVFSHVAAARGALDAVFDPDLSLWDFAPSRILLEEAGGTILVRETGRGRGHDVLLGAPAIVERLARLLEF